MIRITPPSWAAVKARRLPLALHGAVFSFGSMLAAARSHPLELHRPAREFGARAAAARRPARLPLYSHLGTQANVDPTRSWSGT